MAVLIDKNTRLLVQGITGREGTFHAKAAQSYGTTVVGGVTPGKGGTTHEGWPVFNTVAECVRETRANASVIFVPPPGGADAILEAADAALPLAVCITEGIPTLDMMKVFAAIRGSATRVVGPNCPGLITAGQAKAGIIPGHICKEGRVGIVSKSGTLTYEAIHQLTRNGLGQTTCIGIGGDPLIGTSFIDALTLFAGDPQTEAVVMIGEIGGDAEQDAAAWGKTNFKKPVVGFIARRARSSPAGRARRRRKWRRSNRAASAWSRVPPTSAPRSRTCCAEEGGQSPLFPFLGIRVTVPLPVPRRAALRASSGV